MPGVVKFENHVRKDDVVAVMTLKNELVCYGKAAADSAKMEKSQMGVAVKPDAVFMKEGTYPKRGFEKQD